MNEKKRSLMASVEDNISKDWESFVRHIAERHRAGRSDREIGSELGQMSVHWSGVVSETQLEDGQLVAIAVKMSHAEIQMDGGYVFQGAHLSLPVRRSKCRDRCRFLREGQPITFAATLASNEGVFTTVWTMKDDEERKVILRLSLESAEIH